ncbi:MAG: MFS transporter [Saprospiraceae bacterium]|nr:MFS transporter [Saprospiraceae bacterium]
MNRNAIILLFIANAISGVAQGISMIAIPWYFATRDILGQFGLIYIIATCISVFWVPLSGSIIDKYDRRKIFLYLTFVVGAIITLISILGFQLGQLPWVLVGAVFIFTFLNYNLHYPCLYAFVQEISEPKHYAKMTSALEIIGQATTILAGAGATLLLEGTENGILKIFGYPLNIGINISAWEIHEIFLLDSSTYFIAFLIILAIRYTPILRRKVEQGNLLVRIKIGWNYLRNEKAILWFGILSFMVFMTILLEAFYLGVSYINNHLEATGDVYANSKIAYSAGALFIGFSIRFFFHRITIPFLVVFLTALTAIVYLVLFLTKSITILFIVFLVLGITNAGVRVSRITYLFKNVPNQFFGRAGSVFFLFNILMRVLLLGIFTIPFFQYSNNIIYAFLILSVILFITTLLLIIHYKSFDLSLSSNQKKTAG